MELTDLIKLIALDLCNWVAILISTDLWGKSDKRDLVGFTGTHARRKIKGIFKS